MNISASFQEHFINSFDDFEKEYFTIQKNRGFREAVYRGQSDFSWGLVSSIFRKKPNINPIPFSWVKDRIKEEFQSVKYFTSMGARIGFDLPGDIFFILNTKKLTDNVTDIAYFYNWYWPHTNNCVETITLAQHHGYPTRFLDFTFDAYVALYFAAESACKLLLKKIRGFQSINNFFCLWMIDRLYLHHDECNLTHFEVPTSKNRYLYAQRGLFLRPPLPKPQDINIQYNDFDIKEVAIKNCHYIESKNPGFKNLWPVIFVFNFPLSLAPEIIRELDSRKEVNIATLKPNLDNIKIYQEFKTEVNNLWSILKNS